MQNWLIEFCYMCYVVMYSKVLFPKALNNLSPLILSIINRKHMDYANYPICFSSIIQLAVIIGLIYDNYLLAMTRVLLRIMYRLQTPSQIESTDKLMDYQRPRYLMHIGLLPWCLFCYGRFIIDQRASLAPSTPDGILSITHTVSYGVIFVISLSISLVSLSHAIFAPYRPLQTLKYKVDEYTQVVNCRMITTRELPMKERRRHVLFNALPPIIACLAGLLTSLYLGFNYGWNYETLSFLIGCLGVFVVNGAFPSSRKHLQAWRGVCMNFAEFMFMYGLVTIEHALPFTPVTPQ